MGVSRALPVVIAALLALGMPSVTAESATESSLPGTLDLHRNLPRDPLLAFAMILEHPEQEIDAVLEFLGELGGEEYRQALGDALRRLDDSLGLSVQRDLLPLLGPQVTLSIDLPPLDYAMLALSAPSHEAFTAVLGRIGVVADVRDPVRLDTELRALLESTPGEMVFDEGRVGVRIPVWINEGNAAEDEARSAHVTLQYLLQDGRIAVGFSSAWVHDALRAEPVGEKLASGEDFARVFAQLDENATRLSYVNLPKIRTLVTESHILSAVLEDNRQTRDLLRVIAVSDVMEIGLGSTAVAMNGGVRTIHFGPRWLSGAVISSGVLAAVAVPALILNRDEEQGPRTAERVEVIATACEGFATDMQTYPPAEGWVPVERIAPYLEPLYGTALPRLDAWANPILYWSDGPSYRVLSTGEDGEIDRDWTQAITPEVSAAGGGDIVFGDGRFLSGP